MNRSVKLLALVALPLLLTLAGCGDSTSSGGTAPVIASFTASPTSVPAGNTATLSWSVTNATSLSINNGPGVVTGQTSATVTPTSTTTYTLTAVGAGGTLTAKTTVTVTAAQPAAVINSFSASPPSIGPGGSATLSWNTTNATALSIDHGVGTVTGDTGSFSVSPTADTTYTLTATGLGGNATATTTVTVSGAPGLRIDYVDPTNTSSKKIIVTKNTASSTNAKLFLDVKVGAAALTAFGIAMNIPLDHTKATVDTTNGVKVPSSSPPLNPSTGSGATLGWATATSGPLADMLTIGLARHKTSASDSDVTLAAGATLFTLELDVVASPDPANGNILDGSALPASTKMAVLSKAGAEVASKADFAIGTIFITH